MRKLWLILILLTTAGLLMAAPLIEGFESTTAPPLGWYVVYANPYQTQGDFVAHSTDEHYEGDRSFRFSSIIGPTLPTYLITPRLEVTEGDQTISFYYYGYYDSFEEKFKVGWSSTGKEITDFTWSDEITHSSSSWEQYVKDDLPVGTKYVCIQYTSYRQAYFYFDKFVGPELYTGKPDSPVLFFPVNNTPTVALNALLYWYPSLEATSYLFFIGTDAEATNIVNGFDIGNVTSYSPELEYYDTTYYWTIAGVNSLGVSDKATIWSFTSRLHPIRPIPYMQDFNESVYWPSEWVSGGYKIYAGHGNGGNGVLKRLTGTKELDTIASFATCQIGPLAADSELKFDYRFMAYSNYPDDGFYPLAEGDMIEVQISTDDGQSYETIYTIDMNNHINSTQFATPTIPLFGYEGQIVRVKFTTSTPFGTSSDFYVDFDNMRALN
ncbi:MAG TPA: choice-of-anchor J domain-containing protein [Candidatus Cloacimonadota bacterium]|nr:choice-of-anchor J domain-containing protein [Candidatus Cloacimonadota bacterium]